MPPNRSSETLPPKAGRLSGYNPLVLTPRRPARAAVSLFYNWPIPRSLNHPDGLSLSSTRSVHFDFSSNEPWVPVDPSPQALPPLHPPTSFPDRPREPSVVSLRRKSSGYSISTRLTRRQTPSEADFTDDEDEPQEAWPDHSNRSVSVPDAPLSADSISEVRVSAEGRARVGPAQLDGHGVGHSDEVQIPEMPDLQGLLWTRHDLNFKLVELYSGAETRVKFEATRSQARRAMTIPPVPASSRSPGDVHIHVHDTDIQYWVVSASKSWTTARIGCFHPVYGKERVLSHRPPLHQKLPQWVLPATLTSYGSRDRRKQQFGK